MSNEYSPLTKYIHYITGKTNEFDEDINNLHVSTILNIAEDDISSSIHLNNLLNENPFIARNLDIKTIADFHRKIVKSKYMKFMSNKNRKPENVIQEMRKKFPELKDDEIVLLLNLQEDKNDFLEEIGINENYKPKKEKKTFEKLIQSIEKNLETKCSKCSNIKDRVLFDSTTKDLNKIKCLFVGEAPAREEIEQGKPFVGRSGKLLRKTLSEVGFDNIDWGVINTCLCFHEPGNPPTKFEKKMCFDNIEIVLSFLPDDIVIIPLGNHPDERFGISEGITKASQQTFKYNNKLVMPCFHPAAICRDMKKYDMFKSRLEEIYDVIYNNKIKRVKKENQYYSNEVYKLFENETKPQLIKEKPKNNIESKKENLPDDGIMLVDTIYDGENVHYVLRKGNEKIIKTVDDECSIFFGKSKHTVENKNKLKEKRISFRDRWNVTRSLREKGYEVYGSDINIKVQKNIEFRNNYVEKEQQLRIGIIDIELFLGEEKILLDNMEKAGSKYTISLITLYDNYEDKYFTFVYNIFDAKIDKEEIINYLDYKDDCKFEIFIYDNEEDMITGFLDKLSELDPDILSGFNSSGFDWPFIYYRCKHLNIPCANHYGDIVLDEKYGDPIIPYMAEVDYLKLYKERSFGERETYKLDFIAEYELGIKKLHMEERFDDMWKNNPNKFIAYNINDVHLVRLLEDKLKYIDVQYNINRITNVSWRECFGTLATIDGLLYTYLDKNNKTIIAKNLDEEKEMPKLQGAFVRTPIKGMYDWVADLDLSSLYPYIMARYNLSPDTYVGQIDEMQAREYIFKKEEFLKNNDTIVLEDRNGNKKTLKTKIFDEKINKNNLIVTIAGTIYVSHETNTSVLYEIIDFLIEERKKYKKLMLDAVEKNNQMLADRYDNWQTTYKVLTNSLYGAVANKYFRLFHYPTAKTITATGREIVKMGAYHVHHYLQKMKDEGKIDVEPYEFNPNFFDDEVLENIIYGDSVTEDTIIKTKSFPEGIKIKDFFENYITRRKTNYGREYIFPVDEFILTLDNDKEKYKPINNVMKHRTDKNIYRITTESGKEVFVTEDHSIMVERNGELEKVRPEDILEDDIVITLE